MSFKWKWLLTTFFAQIFLGLIFVAIQYAQMTRVAIGNLEKTNYTLYSDLSRMPAKLGPASKDAFTSISRSFYSLNRPVGLWLQTDQKRLFEFGELFVQGAQQDEATLKPLRFSFDFPLQGYTVWVQHDPDVVYRERNEMVVYLLGVFLLSAFACSLILLSLSNALSSRLEDLRQKASELQSGKIHSRIQIKGRDEISVLGAAFNSMAEAIQDQMLSMEKNHARAESEKNRLNLLLSSLGSGVAYLDENFHVLYINKALAGMLRLPFPYVEVKRLEALLHDAGVVEEQQFVLKDLVTDYFGNHKVPIELDFNHGKVLQFRFVIYNDQVQGPHAVLIAEDVSIRKNVEDLRNEVERDPLTGVLNRRGFDLTLEARVARLLPGEILGLLFLDLDGFKAVNDTLGHKAGDQVLKTSATLLKGATRNVDVVARLGGDEFAIVVARCNLQLLTNIATRIIESFAADKLLTRIRQNHGLTVSCSIGGSMYPTHASLVSELIELSDSQMYKSKRAGKNCCHIANSDKSVTASRGSMSETI